MNLNPERPPKHLTKEARSIWRQLNGDYEFDSSALVLLKTALEAYDRMNAARQQVDAEGVTVQTPTGHLKPHPALRIEKEARSGFLQAWRMLNLDIEPPGPMGRPPGT